MSDLAKRNAEATNQSFRDIERRLVDQDGKIASLHKAMALMMVRMNVLEQMLKISTFGHGPTEKR